MVFDLKPLEVRALVEEEIEAIQGFATPHDVRVQLDPAAAQAMARADSIRLAQAVTNLLSNAVKIFATRRQRSSSELKIGRA